MVFATTSGARTLTGNGEARGGERRAPARDGRRVADAAPESAAEALDEAEQRALLAEIARGDARGQDALRRLYALYRPRLWGYLWRQLDGDAGRTEEVTQDVFLAVWRSAASFRGEAQVGAWLFRIAHNLASNARRARDRRPNAQPLDEAPEDAAGMTLASPETLVLDRLALAQAWARLSPRQREALELAFGQGFSMEEIAQILDVPAGTVKSRISYARRALKAALDTIRSAEEASS